MTVVGENQIEQDYKLVENEGLFQEYLEMGKFILKVLWTRIARPYRALAKLAAPQGFSSLLSAFLIAQQKPQVFI